MTLERHWSDRRSNPTSAPSVLFPLVSSRPAVQSSLVRCVALRSERSPAAGAAHRHEDEARDSGLREPMLPSTAALPQLPRLRRDALFSELCVVCAALCVRGEQRQSESAHSALSSARDRK